MDLGTPRVKAQKFKVSFGIQTVESCVYINNNQQQLDYEVEINCYVHIEHKNRKK